MPIAIGCCDRGEVSLTVKLLRQTFGARLRCPNRRRRRRTAIKLPRLNQYLALSRHLHWREVKLPHWQLLIPDWLWIRLSDTFSWSLCRTGFNFVWLTGPEVNEGILEATTTCPCGEIDGRWKITAVIKHDFSGFVGEPIITELKGQITGDIDTSEAELQAFLAAVS